MGRNEIAAIAMRKTSSIASPLRIGKKCFMCCSYYINRILFDKPSSVNIPLIFLISGLCAH
jgi:hypothetical protein